MCKGRVLRSGGRHESWGARASDSSPHSSDESDASFLADTDFAVAVAKAAELSGLTVIGSTVVDPNAGKEREKGAGSSLPPSLPHYLPHCFSHYLPHYLPHSLSQSLPHYFTNFSMACLRSNEHLMSTLFNEGKFCLQSCLLC